MTSDVFETHRFVRKAISIHFVVTRDHVRVQYSRLLSNKHFNPILPGLLNTRQTGGGVFYPPPPPNSFAFYPRSIKFGM